MKWPALFAVVFVAGCSGDAEDDDVGTGPGVLTLDEFPTLTTDSPITITGKKEPDVGVLVDGELKVFQDASTTFSVDLELTEGPNRFILAPVAKSLAMGDDITITIDLDSLPPGLRAVEPADEASGVPLNVVVSATFTELLDCSSSTNAIFVAPTGGNNVAGTVGCSGAVLSFTPSAPLMAGTDYSVTIEAFLLDVAGNELGLPNIWGFRTAP